MGMSHNVLESDSYRLAQLKSERLRTGALIAVGVVFAGLAVARAVLTGRADILDDLPTALVFLAGFVLFETWMLWRVSGALAEDAPLSDSMFRMKVVVEALVPTAAMITMTTGMYLGPYIALTAPALAAYYIFIILAALRLDPVDPLVAGGVSAAGFSGLIVWTYSAYPDHPARDAADLSALAVHAVVLVIAGWVASRVAAQIRTHVGLALREARQVERMGRDLEVARSIQQNLLPQEIPEVAGYEIAGWNDPADETGGDYFDWMTLPDGRAVITLADVTGHGIGPALVTAVCRAYGRANLPTGNGLSVAMGRINALLVDDLPRGKLVQLVAAIVSPQGSIHMLSAGHGPLLVFRAATGEFGRHNAHGVPFGVTAAIGYGPGQQVDLAVGDMLILITDGFYEWENREGEMYDLDRLESSIRDHAERPPQEVIGAMHAGVLAFTAGTPQPDDLTAVIVKRVAG
ncbi:MAG: SpoIIE family protein phosphatase [Acidobacteria bacterium]|nr:SpoIIE family protein phosphatase [Acidobacteriota bacterium]